MTDEERVRVRVQMQITRAKAEGAASEAQSFAQHAQAMASQHQLQVINMMITEAEFALADLNYAEAARLFGEAAAKTPAEHADSKTDYYRREELALSLQQEAVVTSGKKTVTVKMNQDQIKEVLHGLQLRRKELERHDPAKIFVNIDAIHQIDDLVIDLTTILSGVPVV